jgi:tryptophan synthase alpha subunit
VKARIDAKFAALKAEGRAAFIAYVMAGDPDAGSTLDIMRGLPSAGADLIELGFPFSDPMAEGVPIQKAAQRALKGGMTLRKTLNLVRQFRGLPSSLEGEGSGMGANRRVQLEKAPDAEPILVPHSEPILNSQSEPAVTTHSEPLLSRHRDKAQRDALPRSQPLPIEGLEESDTITPVILMGYLNNVLSYGYDAFANDAAEAGVDGLIVVDCPPEEANPLADALDAAGVSLIRLATPTSDDARLKVIAQRTSGFVYYVSIAGVTGAGEADETAVAPAVARVRAASGLPVAVGFGIRTPERAAAIARIADAAVVGSALVDDGAAAVEANELPAPRVLAKAKALADAVHGARALVKV